MLGAYVFINAASSCWYDSSIMQWPSLSFIKVSLVYYEYGYTNFLFPFAWNTFFHLFTLSLCVSLLLKWVSHKWYIDRPCLISHSALPCLLTGEFSPFTFKATIDRHVLIAFVHRFFWMIFKIFKILLCSFLLVLSFFLCVVFFLGGGLSLVLCLDSFLIFFCVLTLSFSLWLLWGSHITSSDLFYVDSNLTLSTFQSFTFFAPPLYFFSF